MDAHFVRMIPVPNEGRIKESVYITANINVPVTIHLKPDAEDLRNGKLKEAIKNLKSFADALGMTFEETEAGHTFKFIPKVKK